MGAEKTKHTPGPWVAEDRAERFAIHAMCPHTGESFEVASLTLNDADDAVGGDLLAGDANLIAAAPDLLEEHRRSLAAFEDLDSCLARAGFKTTNLERCLVADGIRATKAVIAKAEGKS